MAFGILDCKTLESVPGSAILHEQNDIPLEYCGIPTENLKKGQGRFNHVILVPQPSDDPNDPLNWPQWRKDLILVIVGFSASITGAYGPMISPGFVEIARNFDVSISNLAHSTAWLVLCIGLCLFITNPLAKLYGKRPIYIWAIVVMFVSCIWGATSTSWDSFLGSRIFGGLGMAPYEILVQCTLGDIYFVHERATRIAVWNLFLLAGISGGSIIGGYVIENLGYQWTFWLCSILYGLCMIGIVFFVPETTYERSNIHTGPLFKTISIVEKEQDSGMNTPVGTSSTTSPVKENFVITPVALTVQENPLQPMRFLQSLRVYTGRHTTAPFWKILVRPLFVFFYPGILWAFLIYGATISFIVVFSVVNAEIFTYPPYNFTVSQTGLISFSPLVFAILGEAIAGPLNDWICMKLTERNRGIYEPEFRLVLMLFVALFGACGFFGFGATVAYQTHWTGPVLTFGITNLALAFASVCVFGYVIDAHGSLAEEAFVAINARNLFTFGLTYFVNGWLENQGTMRVFGTLGAIFIFVCLLTLPLWVFGKRARSWIARNSFLRDFMADLK